MNFRMAAYVLGVISIIMAIALLVPLFMALGFAEAGLPIWYAVSISIFLAVGIPLVIKKPKNSLLNAKGGFITVSLAWIWVSLITAMPFSLSGVLPNYFDALFETVSGFTTTGATVLTSIESVPKSLLFLRSYTHWLGGMGILVMLVAILPKVDTSLVQAYKAEVPGMTFGKIVSKLKYTARILYAIYIVLTIALFIMLVIGKMNPFDAIIHTFSAAATGGFSNYSLSIGAYNNLYYEIVILIFLLLFGMNFEVYFLTLVGHFRAALKKEELWGYLGIFGVATVLITFILFLGKVYATFGESLRFRSFQVVSIMTTTGFATADFTKWPAAAQTLLVLLMVIGGSSSSTAGGLKVSRFIILLKVAMRDIRKKISPHTIKNIKYDGKIISDDTTNSVLSYFFLFTLILFTSIVLVALTTPLKENGTLVTHVTAVITCFANSGPGLELVGPYGNYAFYSNLSKIILSFNMLLGRLEIYPLLFLFYPKAWKKY